MKKAERRAFGGVELRAEDGQPVTLRGLAAPYYDGTSGTQYELWRGAVERYAPGAFDKAVAGDDIRVLFNHDPNLVLGRTAAGTAKVFTTPRGLEYMVELADTTVGRDVRVGVARGDVTGSSVGMFVEEESWTREDGVDVRTIRRASLLDVSPVTFPAYEGTAVSARDCESAKESFDALQEEKKKQADLLKAFYDAELKLIEEEKMVTES